MQQLSSSLGRYGTPHFSPHRQSTPESVRVFWVYSFTALIVAFIRWNFFIVFFAQRQQKTRQTNPIFDIKTFHKKWFLLYMYPSWQGHPTSIFGKYLFGRRFEIYNFRNICCKISCLPASPRIFEHLKPGITALFNGLLPWKGHLEFSIAFFLAENFEKVSFDAYNFRITRLSARKSKQMKNF